MPLETGTVISELDDSWPLTGDFVREGDDHIRLVKSVLQTQFPGKLGEGYNTVILATEEELNWLQGLTSNVQDQIDDILANDDLKAPDGTVLAFGGSPPLGWAALPEDNRMLRVSQSPGASGGDDNPINWSSAHTHDTKDHVLITGEIPAHSHVTNVDHKINLGYTNTGGQAVGSDNNADYAINITSSMTGGGGAHNHGQTANGGTVFTPRYYDLILAVKG